MRAPTGLIPRVRLFFSQTATRLRNHPRRTMHPTIRRPFPALMATLALPFVACATAPPAQDDPLFAAFVQPATDARPFVRWWWNGGRVNGAEVLRQLDVMKAAGIGGVEINTIAMPEGKTDAELAPFPALDWLSPAWNEAVKAAAQGAHARGMTADLIVGSGWPFGGQFLAPEEQTQRVYLKKVALKGPANFTATLKELLELDPELDRRGRPRRQGPEPTARKLVALRLLPENAADGDFAPGVDVFNPATVGDALSIQVPPGKHTLLAVIWEAGFTHVKLGAPGADGPVVNHYDARAVRKYLDHMSTTLSPSLGGRMGNFVRATFVDSLELDHANWTGDLPEEFKQRRGYDLWPTLPLLLEPDDPSHDSPHLQTVRRARYDFLSTLIELFEERFVATYVAWNEANGTKARIQAYGRETHPLHGGMQVHLPEGETWLWLDKVHRERIAVESTVVNKYVSSAANLTGQRLRSFEAMTNAVPVFRETLQDFKRGFDASLLSGMNHPIIHGFNYTPREAGFPGWVRFGCYLNERSPWWPHFRRFSDYAARLGTVMRGSVAQARVAVLAPRAEEWQHYGLLYQPFPEVHHPWYQYKLTNALHQAGHNVDFVSERILQKATFDGGLLRFGPRAYQALILEDVNAVDPATAVALRRFAEAGGRILALGALPSRAPGLRDADTQDAAVRAASEGVTKSGGPRLVVLPAPVDEGAQKLTEFVHAAMRKLGITPDVEISPPNALVAQVHQREGTRDLFFFANTSTEQAVDFTARCPGVTGAPWQWDAEAGTRFPFPLSPDSGAGSPSVSLHLAPMASLLLVFEPSASPAPARSDDTTRAELAGAGRPEPRQPAATLDLTGPWSIELRGVGADGKGAAPIRRSLPALVDLSLQKDQPELSEFAGVVVYRKTVTGGAAPTAPVILTLGTTHSISEVSINGTSLGARWWGRHSYDVTPALRAGDNQIEIKVFTVLANFMKAKKDDAMAQRWTSWFPPIPSGLVGPVRLLGWPDARLNRPATD